MKNERQKALTLIEVLVAVALFGGMLFILISEMAQAYQSMLGDRTVSAIRNVEWAVLEDFLVRDGANASAVFAIEGAVRKFDPTRGEYVPYRDAKFTSPEMPATWVNGNDLVNGIEAGGIDLDVSTPEGAHFLTLYMVGQGYGFSAVYEIRTTEKARLAADGSEIKAFQCEIERFLPSPTNPSIMVSAGHKSIEVPIGITGITMEDVKGVLQFDPESGMFELNVVMPQNPETTRRISDGTYNSAWSDFRHAIRFKPKMQPL